MPLTNPKELLQFLQKLGVTPKKGLSQNFLIDGNIIRKILAAAHIQAGDSVLEIGPGPGALTEALLQKGAKVTAVEKDTIYAEALKRFPEVSVFNEDIRSFSLDRFTFPTKVVSNLPYHLTAPILNLLIPRHDLFSSITVMVQDEVARRIVAQAKSKDYGSLSVFTHFYSQPRYAFKVSRHCFYPQPKVDSAVVVLDVKKPVLLEEKEFFSWVHKAFQQRRKMLKSTLGAEVGTLLETFGENPQARPEEISLDLFLRLFTALKNSD